jgi:opacity protein-like surface antigen
MGGKEIKRVLLMVLFMIVLFISQVYAADVYVLDEDAYGGPIGGFYSGLYGGPGSTASYISGELTADNIAGGRLLWLIPADGFTSSEISVMSSFLNSGGRIGFLGAWYGFATARDDSINAAISSLGGHISINTNYVDNGYPHYAYRSNDRILSDPLTNGVDSFVYGIFLR